jgi:hypothetical protein
VAQGWLIKQGGRIPTWKRRYFILTHNCLYYFLKPGDKEPCGMVPLENLSVRKSVKQSKKFCFEIYNPELEKNKDKPKIKSCKKTKEGADGTTLLPFDFVAWS